MKNGTVVLNKFGPIFILSFHESTIAHKMNGQNSYQKKNLWEWEITFSLNIGCWATKSLFPVIISSNANSNLHN